MKDVELHITALNASTANENLFVAVLQEINGQRRLPLIIGLQEAQVIAVALEQLQPLRPLTHDLFLTSIASLNATLKHIKITEINKDIYFSVIVLQDKDENLIEIDSRTSDAIALAVRQKCGIFIDNDLFDTVAVYEPIEKNIRTGKTGELEKYTLTELYDLLAKMLKKEDYESAGMVRDIISKKEQR
jgi:bifunctional DNase/RNase